MSGIQHSTRAHAALSASSSHRWMMCPPSVKLSERFADKPSQYAEEGTFLHELCELKLHRHLGDMIPEVLEAQYAAHRDNDFYSDEAESITDEYVDFCIETIKAVRSSCPDPLILVEHRLDYSEYVPEGFGTGDLIIVADGILEIVDFKGGRGVRVEAERNSQLMLYGLGALLEFDPLYDIRTVRMTIVQPRLNNVSSDEITAEELICWAQTEGSCFNGPKRRYAPRRCWRRKAKASSARVSGVGSARRGIPAASAASTTCGWPSVIFSRPTYLQKRRLPTFCP